MQDNTIYHYKKNRKQQSLLFIRMGIACWFYIAGLFAFEYFSKNPISSDLKTYWTLGFGLISFVLFYVAWWHRKNPATYEATITTERFIVDYPFSPKWSFDIKISDINRFEYRQTLGHAGSGSVQRGVLLKDGQFHYVSMNYGNSLSDMFKAIKQVNPQVVFPSKVNKKVFGFINKNYD